MWHRVLVFAIGLLLAAAPGRAAQQRPAVLFATGWVHNNYVVRPMLALGVEVDACGPEKMAGRLASGRYNVVVVSTMSDAQRKAVDAFLARRGGALVCNPEGAWNMKDWPATNRWLAALGARPRWEVLQDGDKQNLARDCMGCGSRGPTGCSAPVKRGVRGLLTVTAGSTTGWEPPMSLDFSPAWTVVARGAATHKGLREVRNDEQAPGVDSQAALAGSPALMGLRSVGPGRLAVVGIRSHWLFTPPYNCPTAEAMLTAGAGGKPSDWLRLFANTIGWLAEPSLAAGMGGMHTPKAVLDPPVTPWEIPPVVQWAKPGAMHDMPQVQGMIGARTGLSSGAGTVAEYVRAGQGGRACSFSCSWRTASRWTRRGWDQLVKECAAASDEKFAAVPGLTYEDAQGDHLYVFGDDVRFPKPRMLLPDRRLATNHSNRTQAYFDYINELVQQHAISGFWNHRQNFLPPADYKLYNSFPIVSFEDGRPDRQRPGRLPVSARDRRLSGGAGPGVPEQSRSACPAGRRRLASGGPSQSEGPLRPLARGGLLVQRQRLAVYYQRSADPGVGEPQPADRGQRSVVAARPVAIPPATAGGLRGRIEIGRRSTTATARCFAAGCPAGPRPSSRSWSWPTASSGASRWWSRTFAGGGP